MINARPSNLSRRFMVVSIHDVSPYTYEKVERMLGELAGWGVEKTALLVIPDHHHRGHFLDDPAFCEWLRQKDAAGHEAVVHGYYHRRPGQTADSGWQRFITQVYTAGEGEFFDLDENEAFERARRGGEELAKAGLHATGFIAPAWLLGEKAEHGVRKADFEYTTRLGSVKDLKRDATFESQSLVYSARAAWRRQVSLLWNAWLFSRLSSNDLLRVGLHPPDYDFPRIWGQIQHLITRALDDREAITYQTWMENWRNRQ